MCFLGYSSDFCSFCGKHSQGKTDRKGTKKIGSGVGDVRGVSQSSTNHSLRIVHLTRSQEPLVAWRYSFWFRGCSEAGGGLCKFKKRQYQNLKGCLDWVDICRWIVARKRGWQVDGVETEQGKWDNLVLVASIANARSPNCLGFWLWLACIALYEKNEGKTLEECFYCLSDLLSDWNIHKKYV